MAKKKPAKPAKKPTTASRKPERSKGELSSDDLESVSGGIIVQSPVLGIKGEIGDIGKVKIAPGGGLTNLPTTKIVE
jgi:hypothetical protein